MEAVHNEYTVLVELDDDNQNTAVVLSTGLYVDGRGVLHFFSEEGSRVQIVATFERWTSVVMSAIEENEEDDEEEESDED